MGSIYIEENKELNNIELFNDSFDKNIEILDLSDQIIKKKRIDLSYLINLKKLIINSNVEIIFSLYLKELVYGNNFCFELNNLPNGLTHLMLGDLFNKSIDNLPNGLTNLVLGDSFNKSVDNLPNSIRYLKFGWNFNQSVDNLPENLEELIFYNDKIEASHNNYPLPNFNHSINNLPNKLKKIILNAGFCNQIDLLPDSVEEIIFSNNIEFDLYKRVSPTCVSELSSRLFNYEIKRLPINLKKLVLSSEFNNKIYWSNQIVPLKKLEYLEFQNISVYGNTQGPYKYSYGCFNQTINNLPDTINVLKLGSGFTKKINKLPNNISELYITNYSFDYDNYLKSPQNNFTSFTDFEYIIRLFRDKLDYIFNKKIDFVCKFNQIDVSRLILENYSVDIIKFICEHFNNYDDYEQNIYSK